MSARDDLVYRITRHCSAETADQLLDAYRAEVLNEAAEILRGRATHYPTRRVFSAGLRHGALIVAKAAMGRTER
jgi:hypothetical protein